MTARSAASRSASNSTTASARVRGHRGSSRDDSAENPDDGERPVKRQRLNTSSTTTPIFHHSHSTTPIPYGSNQDAEIPDIIPSLEGPLIDNFDHDSMVGDDEQSMEDNRAEDDESDAPSYVSPVFIRREWMSNFQRLSTPDDSIAGSSIPRRCLQDDEDDLGSDQDLQKASRRMPGRRRAPNADPHLEASLRRQLQLRIGHRAVSKALKPILLELASRTINYLEHYIDEEAVMTLELDLQSELRRRLDRRLEQLETTLKLGNHYYNERLAMDDQYLRRQFLDFAASIHEDYYVKAENKILALARQYDHDIDENVTDDEDGTVVRPLHRSPSSQNPGGTMPDRYDSRSRFFLVTQRLSENYDFRSHVKKQQIALLHDNNDRALEDGENAINVEAHDLPSGFALRDGARRTQAVSALNLHSLASAASEIEEQALLRLQAVVPNEKAFGLQALVAALDYANSRARRPKTDSAVNSISFSDNHESKVKTEHGREETFVHEWPPVPVLNSQSHVPGAAKTESDYQQRVHGTQYYEKPPMETPTPSRLAHGHYVLAPTNIGSSTVSARHNHHLAECTMSGQVESQENAITDPTDRLYSSIGLRLNPVSGHKSRLERNGSSRHSDRPGQFWQSILSNERRLLNSDGKPKYNSYQLPQNDQKLEANATIVERRQSDATHVTQERDSFRPHSPQLRLEQWQHRGDNLEARPLDDLAPPARYPDLSPAVQPVTRPAIPGAVAVASQGLASAPAAQQYGTSQPAGVFFGPAPSPQFGGPPSGPPRQFPWYRQ